ncbi:MFS transporter [Bacillus velezensis]
MKIKDEHQVLQASQRKKLILLVIGVILIGANLRAPLTSVGPLVSSIRDSLGMTNAAAGTITTVPLLAFACLSPFVPLLSRRFGTEIVLLSSLIVLTAGTLPRSIAGIGTLFFGTILLGLSIAVCNVLLPSLIKHKFPGNLGIMTGVYSVSMNLCGAIASGISVPIASSAGVGWKGALGPLGYPFFYCVRHVDSANARTRTARPHDWDKRREKNSLMRSPLAWKVTMFMGPQSLIFYTVIAWSAGNSSAEWTQLK